MSLEKQARIKVTARTDQAQQELAKLGSSADRASGKVRGLGEAAAKAGKGGIGLGDVQTVAAGLIGTAVAMDRVVQGGMRFDALMKNLPFGIDAAREATKGFISETGLMDGAIRANRAGIVSSAAEYAEWAKTVQGVAMSTGQDSTEAMEILTRAVANQETKLLDNYGVILKVENAQRILGARMAESGHKITEAEKATAFQTIAMERLRDIAAKSAGDVDEFTASWMRFKAIVTDVPRMVHGARDAIYDTLVALDEWDRKADRFVLQTVDMVGDGRRGIGLRGIAQAAREATMALLQTKQEDMLKPLEEWTKGQREFGMALGKMTTDKLTGMAVSAFEDGIYGKPKGHKKRSEEIIIIYDNFWEEIQGRQRLIAMESQAFIERQRELGNLRSIDPFQKDPKAQFDAQRTLNASLRELEVQRASERDEDLGRELERIDTERAAKMDLAAFEMRTAEDAGQMRAAQEEMAQIDHEARIQRIGIEIKAEQKRRVAMQQIGSSIANVHSEIATAAIRGAFTGGQSVKAAVRHMAAAKAQEMLILGATEEIQAIAAFATLNIPMGIAHQTAAGLAFGEAALLGATYAVLGGGGGRGRNAAGFSGSAFDASPGGGGGAPSSSGGSGRSIGEGPPISRPSQPSLPPPSSHHSKPHRTTHIAVHNYSILPADAEQQMIVLRRELARSEREHPGVD